tara:strand:+ start:4987 stop:5508 length:522 start_codon:yes stop_codon:yes gene_type:complete
MKQQNSKSTKRTQTSNHLLTGSIIALVLIFSPYLLYIYKSFPVEKTWETFFGTYSSDYWQSVQTSAWVFFGKFTPLLFLTIWFFTCKHWWFHSILIPIAIYIFQIFSLFNDDLRYADEVEIWWVFPIMLVVTPLVYLIRAKLFAKVRGDDMETFEEDLGRKRTFWQQILDLFR